MGIKESMGRHPAGNLKRKAEESPHSLGWALGMAKKLGEKSREKEIIDFLQINADSARKFGDTKAAAIIETMITLIKGVSK